ncbi:hypothetical protein [Piscinibacter sakaiensis]|uniref:hypothetical protein n=1 Tax=Piscinibacter sakaiensis TaxID=1547922 RepID=UPI003AADC644
MYDDVLNATTLIGVSAVIAAVFVGAAIDTPREAALASAKPAAVATVPATVAPAAVMPVYELPRVVVTGHRSRDGDVLAVSDTPAPAAAAAARQPAR